MSRMRRHKIKNEKPETSSASGRKPEEHDLAYYIHDRVELMHQVFSVLKHKDLRAMAPECVRRLSIDNLQELCTEELLGISSKRLLAILDGAEPPSDTESSSQSSHPMETISLDSISSDEELLSHGTGKKKKHKHRHRESKSKKRRASSPEAEAKADAGPASRASRAGLTVLELLELQARARAIRAQLQQEQRHREADPAVAVEIAHCSDSEVEIKEEPPIVVEISSDDEKPDLDQLKTVVQNKEKTKTTSPEKVNTTTEKNIAETNKEKDTGKKKRRKDKSKKKDKEEDKGKDDKKDKGTSSVSTETTNKDVQEGNKITKIVNDLIITVPKSSTRKIKLNRNKVTVSIANTDDNKAPTKARDVTVIHNMQTTNDSVVDSKPTDKNIDNIKKVTPVFIKPDKTTENSDNVAKTTDKKAKDKKKDKRKKKEKRESIDEDHDEITLQLSDSEKLDLLENFDKKHYDNVSSSSSDSESSSSDTSEDESQNTSNSQDKTKDTSTTVQTKENTEVVDQNVEQNEDKTVIIDDDDSREVRHDTIKENDENARLPQSEDNKTATEKQDDLMPEADKNKDDNSAKTKGYVSTETQNCIVIMDIEDIPLRNNPDKLDNQPTSSESPKTTENLENKDEGRNQPTEHKNEETATNSAVAQENPSNNARTSEKELSEGELSDNESSDVEALDLQPEVVSISDEETPKKKKKKDKKSKKEKIKKKSVCRGVGDPNFFDENSLNSEKRKENESIDLDDYDDVYEILELSDEDSCYEIEGTTLSKEPTLDEIAAISAIIDGIDGQEVTTEEQMEEKGSLEKLVEKKGTENSSSEVENLQDDKNTENSESEVENISWKDRYLSSKKVKKVLTTANIVNALRKKNKDLKRKMEETKKRELEMRMEEEKKKEEEIAAVKELEGSMEHFNTLQGSTKYVDPIPDPKDIQKDTEEVDKDKQDTEEQRSKETQVTGDIKRDAKRLLKMYKKLKKYNDINKPKDPNKKKSKKKKKEKKTVDNS